MTILRTTGGSGIDPDARARNRSAFADPAGETERAFAAGRPADPVPIVRSLVSAFRLDGLYPNGHPQVDGAVSELAQLIQERLDEQDMIRIDIVEGEAHSDGVAFRKSSQIHRSAIDEMMRLGLHSIRIRRGIERAEIESLVRILSDRRGGTSITGSMHDDLQRRGVRNATIGKLVELDTRWNQHRWGELPTGSLDVSYADALDRAHQAFDVIEERGVIEVQSVRELLEHLTAEVAGRRAALGHVVALKQFENHTYCHSVNVTLLSMMLGKRIGLSSEALSKLSEAALLHDVGKTRIPISVLRKPAPLDDSERSLVQQHPLWGAEMLIDVDGLSDLSPTVALEHHVGYDGIGYPSLGAAVRPHPASQLVAVCDIYEALTGARAYRMPVPPDQACLTLAELAGTKLNPDLVRAFVNLVTFFPVGSIVRTDRGDIGVVVETNGAEPLHPVIVIVRSEDPRQERGRTIDTSVRNEQGEYVRQVVETLRPHEERIDPGEVLIQMDRGRGRDDR